MVHGSTHSPSNKAKGDSHVVQLLSATPEQVVQFTEHG